MAVETGGIAARKRIIGSFSKVDFNWEHGVVPAEDAVSTLEKSLVPLLTGDRYILYKRDPRTAELNPGNDYHYILNGVLDPLEPKGHVNEQTLVFHRVTRKSFAGCSDGASLRIPVSQFTTLNYSVVPLVEDKKGRFRNYDRRKLKV